MHNIVAEGGSKHGQNISTFSQSGEIFAKSGHIEATYHVTRNAQSTADLIKGYLLARGIPLPWKNALLYAEHTNLVCKCKYHCTANK